MTEPESSPRPPLLSAEVSDSGVLVVVVVVVDTTEDMTEDFVVDDDVCVEAVELSVDDVCAVLV